MQLKQHHIEALSKAETLMVPKDFGRYLELKELLPNATEGARIRFRKLFTKYYGLNVGGLTDTFKDRFFEILFSSNVIVNNQPNFAPILKELMQIRRKKGDYAMSFSFVSKLVAIHQEKSPIYDKHVLNFFGEKAPPAATNTDERIAWYVGFLNSVANHYMDWSTDARVTPVLTRLKNRDQRLAQCDVIRLMDFLVWKVGNKKLL